MKIKNASELKKCWVFDTPKNCYSTKEEAEVAAQVAGYDHGGVELSVYKCEYGNHYHLSSKSNIFGTGKNRD